jgi:hypothetical protein
VAEIIPSPLAAWQSFYVIVGSSAAALTGLQFVVLTLVAQIRGRTGTDQLDAFATPTIVHFCAALFIAAILSAPWDALASAALVLRVVGVLGVIYVLVVTRRAMRQTGYRPVLEDWVWHTVLPLVAYLVLLAGAFTLLHDQHGALFMTAITALLLVYIGIHNAWDTVTYIAAERIAPRDAAATDEANTR